MNILITGAGGFVGTWASKMAARAGWNVTALSRKGHNSVDLADEWSLAQTIKNCECDAILHLGAIAHPQSCNLNPKLAHKVNVEAVRVVSENAPSSCTVVFSSSVHVYGVPKNIPIREEDHTNPVSLYGRLKLEAESYVLKHPRGIVARAFHHTGPGQRAGYLFPDWLEQSEPVKVGNIDLIRDFLDVRDVVQAYLVLSKQTTYQGIVNVCSGLGTSLTDVLKIMGINRYVQSSKRMRSNDDKIIVGCNRKLKEMGWIQKYTLEDTISHMKEHILTQQS